LGPNEQKLPRGWAKTKGTRDCGWRVREGKAKRKKQAGKGGEGWDQGNDLDRAVGKESKKQESKKISERKKRILKSLGALGKNELVFVERFYLGPPRPDREKGPRQGASGGTKRKNEKKKKRKDSVVGRKKKRRARGKELRDHEERVALISRHRGRRGKRERWKF